MKNRNELRPYQMAAIDQITQNQGTYLLCSIGAGKTIITMTALQDGCDFPALVVAPKRVCELVWEQEAQEWAHTRHLTFSRVLGSPAQRARALVVKADIYLINYENLAWLMGPDAPLLPDFQAIAWDEISKMKTLGKRYKAVRKWAKQIPVRIGMTGSPTGNHLLGIWPQTHLIDNTDALLRSKTAFKKEWFYQADFKGYDFQPFPGAVEEIAERMAPFTFRMDPEDYQDLPELVENDILIKMPTPVFNEYTRFETTMVHEYLEDKARLAAGEDPEVVEALNRGVLINKLRQFAAGKLYRTKEEKDPLFIHDLKMDALADLVDELAGEPLLLFYDFKYQLDDILARFPQAVSLKTEQHQDDWNAGKIEILVAHPASAGHGLNLQMGGAMHVCFLSTNWSREMYEQAYGRLRRSGQESDRVIVHRLITQGTADEDVVAALAGHGSEQDTFQALVQKHMP